MIFKKTHLPVRCVAALKPLGPAFDLYCCSVSVWGAAVAQSVRAWAGDRMVASPSSGSWMVAGEMPGDFLGNAEMPLSKALNPPQESAW